MHLAVIWFNIRPIAISPASPAPALPAPPGLVPPPVLYLQFCSSFCFRCSFSNLSSSCFRSSSRSHPSSSLADIENGTRDDIPRLSNMLAAPTGSSSSSGGASSPHCFLQKETVYPWIILPLSFLWKETVYPCSHQFVGFTCRHIQVLTTVHTMIFDPTGMSTRRVLTAALTVVFNRTVLTTRMADLIERKAKPRFEVALDTYLPVTPTEPFSAEGRSNTVLVISTPTFDPTRPSTLRLISSLYRVELTEPAPTKWKERWKAVEKLVAKAFPVGSVRRRRQIAGRREVEEGG